MVELTRAVADGRFNLRVSPELHERLSIESNKIGESLNQYCVRALREAAGPK
jgi:predicted HicB family RNase H-like nuclease